MSDKRDLKELLRDEDFVARKKILDNFYELNKGVGIPQAESDEYDPKDLQTKTYEKMGFTTAEAVQIFLDHRYLPRAFLAEKYGLERLFQHEKKKPVNVIQRIYQDIQRKTDEYKDYITKEQINEVSAVVENRIGTFGAGGEYGLKKSVKHVIASPIMDIIKKYESLEAKSANIMELKLDSIKTKKDVEKVDMKKAADVLKTLVELKRLEKGEATEHVAHIIKTEKLGELSTSELINMMNQQRAQQSADK